MAKNPRRRPTDDELALMQLHRGWLAASEKAQRFFLEWTQSQEGKQMYQKIQNLRKKEAA
jgi:hypothetical protein